MVYRNLEPMNDTCIYNNIKNIYIYTVKPAHEVTSIKQDFTCIKRSPFSCPVTEKFI